MVEDEDALATLLDYNLMKEGFRVERAADGEEALLRPAHAIFFSGCTATCRFCTAAKIAFRPTYGVVVSPAQLAARMVQRQRAVRKPTRFVDLKPALTTMWSNRLP